LLVGDDSCPNYDTAAATFEDSSEFSDNIARTKSFYEQFWGTIKNVYNYK
jgi:hypothetical protein